MLAQGSGKIINIASMLTFQGGAFVPSYAAAKGGVGQLTMAFANEWAAKGVNVNVIAPGYMATDNPSALRANPVRSRQIIERIPAGRWGAPTDLAGAAVFLASRANDYVHGHILVVDGGWLSRSTLCSPLCISLFTSDPNSAEIRPDGEGTTRYPRAKDTLT